jgi:hypothetical protein
MAGYTPSYTTDPITTQRLMQMLNALYLVLTSDPSKGDADFRDMVQKCATQEGRKDLCEKYGVPVTPSPVGGPNAKPLTIGDDFVYYNMNGTGQDGVAQAVLNAFEQAMCGVQTPANDKSGNPLQSLEYSALCSFFSTLLDMEAKGYATYWREFRAGGPSTREAMLDKMGMNTNEYGEKDALKDFNLDGKNEKLQESLKDLSETLYNQYRFAC